jgi:hypothetical protein
MSRRPQSGPQSAPKMTSASARLIADFGRRDRTGRRTACRAGTARLRPHSHRMEPPAYARVEPRSLTAGPAPITFPRPAAAPPAPRSAHKKCSGFPIRHGQRSGSGHWKSCPSARRINPAALLELLHNEPRTQPRSGHPRTSTLHLAFIEARSPALDGDPCERARRAPRLARRCRRLFSYRR